MKEEVLHGCWIMSRSSSGHQCWVCQTNVTSTRFAVSCIVTRYISLQLIPVYSNASVATTCGSGSRFVINLLPKLCTLLIFLWLMPS